jgi:hypothetical protein
MERTRSYHSGGGSRCGWVADRVRIMGCSDGVSWLSTDLARFTLDIPWDYSRKFVHRAEYSSRIDRVV